MKLMTNKEIQAINLDILRRIDKFCKHRSITYFLDSGALLGAARNGEFIEWDDDADIVMPRPDYERFVAEYEDDAEYKLYAPSRGNCFLPYARLCEMQRTYFGQSSRWTDENPGVGVDIMPLDGAPDMIEDYDKHAARIVELRDKLWLSRSELSGRRKIIFRREIFGFIKDCVHYMAMVLRRPFSRFLIKRNLQKIRHLRLKYPYNTSSHCFYIVVQSGRRRFWLKEWFSQTVNLKLCGESYPAPIGWDSRLAAAYGDWRTPPPESERNGHTNVQKMYWRDK